MRQKLTIPEHIALVGLGPDRELCTRTEAEAVWGINTLNLFHPVDVLFNMHELERDLPEENDPYRTRESLELALREGTPVVSCSRHPDYPNVVPYPIQTIVEAAGIDYFTCTTAYALAFAVFTGVKRIDLYGLTGTENYEHQHPCLEYWIGRGHGHGVDIRSHGAASRLLRVDIGVETAPVKSQTRYGYHIHPIGAHEFMESVLGSVLNDASEAA